MMTSRGLIATVGGTAEPIIETIKSNQPEFALFIVSADSRDTAELAVEASELTLPMRYECLVVSDPQHFGTSYEEILQGTEKWLAEHKLCALEVTADITGGTKALSAALALSGAERFRKFTYIGGDNRDKGGLGTVISGSEEIVTSLNPWDTYAVRDLERANRLLEKFHADIAAILLEEAAGKCGDSYKRQLVTFSALAKALAASDRFDFSKAVCIYEKRREELAEAFDADTFAKLEELYLRWQKLLDETKDKNVTPGRETLLELFANAERRKAQGRCDDAVGRLYRAVELHGQQLVKQAFKGELGHLKLRLIPEHHREQFCKDFRSSSSTGVYKLSLTDLYRSLKFSECPSLRKKVNIGYQLRQYTELRNNSLIAHGVKPFPNEKFKEFRKAALQGSGLKMNDVPRWPSLQLKLLS